MRSCWLLRNYVNRCVPGNTETRQGKKTHTHSALSALAKQFHEKEEKGGGGRDLKSVARREMVYSSTQKQEQSFIFAFQELDVTVVSSRYKCEIKHDLKNEGGLPGYFPLIEN